MDQPKYPIEIFWSDEDGGYIANVVDLQYCSAFGESYEEALREGLVAMELHLDTLRKLGRPIPDPGSRRVMAVNVLSSVEDVIEAADAVDETFGQDMVGDRREESTSKSSEDDDEPREGLKARH